MVMLEWDRALSWQFRARPSPGAGSGSPRVPQRRILPRLRLLRAARCGTAGPYVPHRTGRADAVLLTSIGLESANDGDHLSRALITAVVADLVRRGVRALEAFGRTALVDDLGPDSGVPTDPEQVIEVLGDCSAGQCIIDANLLIETGFEVAAPHPYFPRLRLELEQGWDGKRMSRPHSNVCWKVRGCAPVGAASFGCRNRRAAVLPRSAALALTACFFFAPALLAGGDFGP